MTNPTTKDGHPPDNGQPIKPEDAWLEISFAFNPLTSQVRAKLPPDLILTLGLLGMLEKYVHDRMPRTVDDAPRITPATVLPMKPRPPKA